jgi:predicted glycosyltransferase
VSAPRRPPVLFHCQHLLGLGHVHRSARLARALVEAGEEVLLVTGGLPVPGLDAGGAEIVPLPPLVAEDDAVRTVVRPDGTPPTEAYLQERADRLLALVDTRQPALILLELFPFGRHALAFELAPLLFRVADDRDRRGSRAPRVAVSVRDVLVAKPNPAWRELATLAVTRQWVDRVFVHGSPDLIPFSRSFGLADRLRDRLCYTGYLADPGAARGEEPRRQDEILVSAGGGRVGGALFRLALGARARSRGARLPWRLLTGPYLPSDERTRLEAEVEHLPPVGGRRAVTIETFRPDFPALLRHAALSVSQAGYNTVLDLLQARVRAVVVPFEGSGDEQPVRARLLAERHLLRVVPAAEATPARLAAAMDEALAAPGPPAPVSLALDGVRRTVEAVQAMVHEVHVARARP